MRHSRRLFGRRTGPWRPADHVHALWGRASGRLQQARREAVDAATAKREAMIAAAGERRGTRKRSIPTMAVGLVGLAAMFGAVSRNALAVNFTTSNDTIAVYSNYLEGTNVAAYLAANELPNETTTGVAEFGIGAAKFAGLCAIATQDLPALGPVSLLITAGQPVPNSYDGTTVPEGVALNNDGTLADNNPLTIAASNLFLNSNALGGYGNQIRGLNLGQSAGSLPWPGDQSTAPPPAAGGFGLSAGTLNLAGLDAETYGVSFGGEISLPKLKLQVLPGEKTQADCSTEPEGS